MIRAVLAVLLAVALLSVSLTAIDDVARERTAAQMDRAVERIDGATTQLLGEDPGPTARLAPRRLVTLSLSTRSLTTARVERIAIDAGTDADDTVRIRYSVAGRPSTDHRLTAPIATPGGPVVLRGSGDRTLVLRLVRDDEDPLVLLSRRTVEAPSDGSGTDSTAIRSAARVQIAKRGQPGP